MIYEILPAGKKNAIKKETLCAEFNLDARSLRKRIERERASGAVILSNSGSGGYYKPSNIEELDEFIRMQKSQIRSRYRSIRSAQKLKREMTEEQSGQMKLDIQED